MRFVFYFRLSSFLLPASGFLALLITDEYGLLAALLFGTLLTLGWFVDAGKLTLSVPRALLNALTLLFLAFCVIDVLYLRRIMAIGMVNFLVFLQATKLVFPKKDRDYVIIYILSFFELLISSIMTFSMLFAFSCLTFIVTGSWALIMFHLKQEIQQHVLRERAPGAVGADENAEAFNLPALNTLVNLKFFSGTFGITIVTCFLSLLVFLILPRAQEGVFFSYGSQRFSQKVSGFSGEVELDSFGMIRQDHTPVMQIELPQVADPLGFPERLYWKGISYNFYDGRRWRSDEFYKNSIPRTSRHDQPKFWLRKTADPGNLIRQDVKLLSDQFKVIFGANRLYGVEGRFYTLSYDTLSGNVEVTLNPNTRQYAAFSDLTRPSERALRSDRKRYPEEIRQAYLQIPELSERVSNLAAELRRDAGNPYDTAFAILEYLQQNYKYSLQVQRLSGLLPLEDFLFVNKAGHCEYYASAMTMLLRLSGIPSRLVNGFAQGRWNEFGRFFTVRQSDAHAWVEVFFPSYGWISFDPTPAAAFGEGFQQFAEQNSLLGGLYRYSEYLRVKWNRYVIDYSLWEQANLAVDAFHATRSAHAKFMAFAARVKTFGQRQVQALPAQHIGFILALAAVFVGGLLFWRRMFPDSVFSFPGRHRRAFSGHGGQLRFYTQMLSILARKGIVKSLSATPSEFVSYIDEKYPAYAHEVRELTRLYYVVRYGEYALADEDARQVEKLLVCLRKRTHKSKRRGLVSLQ